MAEQLQRIPNQKLQQERARRGWKQQDVAQQIELPDVRTYRRWELGESFPTAYYREKLCTLFGKSEEELGLIRRPAFVEIPATPPLTTKRYRTHLYSLILLHIPLQQVARTASAFWQKCDPFGSMECLKSRCMERRSSR